MRPVLPPSTSSSCSLVPIRIDAWSSDKCFRLIDSLLYDLSAPPPPVVFPTTATGATGTTGTPAEQLAYQICADAEVMGMGRTARHFTNRLEVWKPELQREVARQITAQLDAAAAEGYHRSSGRGRKKRPWRGADDDPTNTTSKKPREADREDPDPVPSLTQTQSDPKTVPPSITALDVSSRDDAAVETFSKGHVPLAEPSLEGSIVVPHASTPELVASTCLRIRLRMAAYGVRVHDDLFVDPNHPDSSPLLLAQSIGDDLKLPYEVVQALAMEISEQMRGRVVQDDVTLQDGGDEGHPPSVVVTHPDNVSAAWVLEQRVHISNVAHLVQQHRPESMVVSSSTQSPTPTTSNSKPA